MVYYWLILSIPLICSLIKLEKYKNFYEAEDYHQDYLDKNPNGYTCHFIREDKNFITK